MFISLPAEPKLNGNYSHFVSYGARLFVENPFLEYDSTSNTTLCGTQANNANPNQGLHYSLMGCYIKFEKNDLAFKENVFNEKSSRLAIDRSICILTRPVVNTGFNRSLLVDWWSFGRLKKPWSM